MSALRTDFILENCGTIFLLRPQTETAEAWANDNLPDDAPRFGYAVAVEHRYIANIVRGIQTDGLTVA